MFVNSVWAQQTIPHLWNTLPPAESYLALKRPHRLQYYAKEVTYLGKSFLPCVCLFDPLQQLQYLYSVQEGKVFAPSHVPSKFPEWC